ncbi:Methyl-accepting chemotaxis protein III [compost metagenome]
MHFLLNRRIGTRLMMSSALVGVFFIFALVAAGLNLGTVRDRLLAVTDDTVPSLLTVGELNDALARERRLLLINALASSKEIGAETEQMLEAEHAKVLTAIDTYEKSRVANTEQRDLIAKIRKDYARYYDGPHLELMKLSRLRDAELWNKKSVIASGVSAAQFRDVAALAAKLRDMNVVQADEAKKDAIDAYSQALWHIIAWTLTASALGLAACIFVARTITRPLSEAVGTAQAIAQGDLTSTIQVRGKDEVAALVTAFKAMQGNLSSMAHQLRAGAESVATAAGEISEGNANLSSRTEEQAASLEETAASMEELTATVKQNEETAEQAHRLSSEASQRALAGGEAVDTVVATMGLIAQSSKKISEITSVIESVAFQTNLLALNAAVEAARAGEQGRGFAVVAAEVRTLAQRTAAAAKEIGALLSQSSQQVDSGVKQVSAAVQTIQDVVSAVGNVNTLVNEISLATREQSSGIQQVNQAIAQLDATTQQNAALVEESAAAADSLRQQSAELLHTANTLKT